MAIGGPPIAAILANMPDNIPAINKLKRLILTLNLRKLRITVSPTITAMARPSTGCGASISRATPIKPPGIRPSRAYCMPSNFNSLRSLNRVNRAIEKPIKITGTGTSCGSTIYNSGEAITASPKPIRLWVSEPKNIITEANNNVVGSITVNTEFSRLIKLLEIMEHN